MKLHQNKSLFQQAIRATAEKRNLPEIYIEKDYWVTLALKLIFQQKPGEYAVFKGGTALSKCYGMIERFSEDIDLVVLQEEGESSNDKAKKIRAICKSVERVLPEEDIEGLTNKTGMIRKTAHTYPKLVQGELGQVRDKIVIEATWFGHHEPYTRQKISSYVYETMVQTGQEELAKEQEMLPFEVNVLQPKRTLCEKIMSLVRFSYGEYPLDDLKKKIRHTYDLHQMLQREEISNFFDSEEFENMLKIVATGDVKSFRNNKDWLKHHPNEAKIFADLEAVVKELKGTYEGEFKELVYGDFPKWGSVVESLGKIREKISGMNWEIDLSGQEGES